MEQLMGFASKFDKDGLLQKFAGHDDDDREAVNKSLEKVEREGVREADENDIDRAKAAHDKVYKDDGDADDDELGKAAGTQAFKKYEEEEQRSEGGAGGKDALVQMAIAEAMKMFGKSGGGGGGGDKSAILQTAITTAMGLFMSKKGGSEGSSGGMQAQLMGLLAGAAAGAGKKKSDDDEEGGSQGGGNPLVGMLGSMGGEKGQAIAGVLGKFM
ncbi:hypothetical protein BGZ73_002721 [Actinomortierella ambigua]|nr:hypothetical protein BGZ73_002721 [Actinomortierella ambigua]